jgi:hypothetical protein
MNKLPHLLILIGLLFLGCKRETPNTTNPPPDPNEPTTDSIFGYGVLEKVKGIWNGPVTSSTALGGYPEWIVDFRPISPTQISAKNELDTLNDIHMSFFVAFYNNNYRIAFRNGGSFNGMTRVSYFLADSVSETNLQSYYRFSEILKGKIRAFTEVIRKQDSLIILSYTNKSNSLNEPVLHMAWRAKLQDTTSAQTATTLFNFPQHAVGRNLSQSFQGVSESIYYNTTSEPYAESEQPYLGKSTINYSFAPNLSPIASKKVFILLTTQPLINGFSLNYGNMKFRSRYVILNANNPNYTFNYMHPGGYYVYALYDKDGSMGFSSGDWVSTTNTSLNLSDKGTTTANVLINFAIP